MTDSVPIRHLLDDVSSVDDQDLALEVFSGLVFGQFNKATVFFDSVNFANVGPNKGAQFVRGGQALHEIHTGDGSQMLGQAFSTTSGLIVPQNTIVSHADISWEDDDLVPWSIIPLLAEKQGRALAEESDERIARLMSIGAGTAAVLAGDIHPGGQVVTVGGVTVVLAFPATAVGAEALRDAIWEAAQKFDEDNLPLEDRKVYITPYLHRVLGFGDDKIFDKDWGAQGMTSTRAIGMIGGFEVVVSNSIPQTDFTTGPALFQNDDLLTAAVFSQGNQGIWGVQPRGISVTMQADHRRRTTFVSTALRVGYGVVRTEALGHIVASGA